MCQKDLGIIGITSKPIKVYRIQLMKFGEKEILPLYHKNFDGTDCPIELEKVWPEDIIVKAEGFDKGFGFMSFEYIVDAKDYLVEVVNKTGRYFIIFGKYSPIMVPAEIPSGSKVIRGEIEKGYVGEGIITIRSDHLIMNPKKGEM